MKSNLIFFILFCTSISSGAQNLQYAGLFPTIDHSGDITNKFGYGLYYFGAFPVVNLEKPNPSEDANFLLFYSEQSLSYKLTNKFTVTGSYVYQRANAVYDNYVNENRLYGQAKYKHSFNKVNFAHRLRFDARFIQNRMTNNMPFTHRARYLIGLDFAINEKLYYTMYEEAFFNTFKNAGVVYGENWAYSALGLKLNQNNKIEAGILYITWNVAPSTWFNQYYLQVTYINHLDFRKNKEQK